MEIKLVLKNNKYTGDSCKDIIFVNDDGNQFHGALFWKHSHEVSTGERVRRIYKTYEVKGDTLKDKLIDLMFTYKEWCEENDIKYFDSTPRTMMHWQFINGFSDLCIGLDEANDIQKLVNIS